MHLESYLNIAIDAAKTAGQYLKQHFPDIHTVTSKSHINDLVTECDRASELMIKTLLKKHYPTDSFLCEESGVENHTGSHMWIIDPLDGTVNFAKKIPFFSVSIALMIHNEIAIGVVYSPMTDEMFYAAKGIGSFLNGSKITVSSQTHLSDAFGATGFPYLIAKNLDKTLKPLTKMLSMGTPLRRLGSAALDLAYVAAGRFDLFFEAHLEAWDFAAGQLLVQEAGGRVTDFTGHVLPHTKGSSLLATNNTLHNAMLAEVLHA